MEDEKEKKIKEIREVHAKQNESLKANYQGKMKLTIWLEDYLNYDQIL